MHGHQCDHDGFGRDHRGAGHIAAMQEEGARLLEERFARGLVAGELVAGSSPDSAGRRRPAVWHGLSAQSNRSGPRPVAGARGIATHALKQTYTAVG